MSSPLLEWSDHEGHWVYTEEFVELQRSFERRYFRPFLKELSEWLDEKGVAYPERLAALKVLLDLQGYIAQGRDLDWIITPVGQPALEGREIVVPQVKRPGKRKGKWEIKKD